MVQKSFFQKHHKRLVTEAVLKAVLCGALAGFCADFLAALVAWFFDLGGIWLAIGIGAAVGVVTGVILYFAKFRPSIEDLAKRVDRLGLEERMVTMLQLQQDDSIMARLQRENAKEHLKDVEDRKLRLRMPKSVIALAVIALVLCSGMTTVLALAEENILPPGSELIDPDDPMAELIAISYIAGEGGEIEGETDQLLLPGEDGLPVVAVAEDGWVFVGWDDGFEHPERQETGVTAGGVYTAMFQEILEDGDPEGEESGDGKGGQGGEGDKAADVPGGGETNADTDQAGSGDKGSGSGSDSSNQGGQGEGQEQGEGKGDGKGQGAGGKWEDSNQFLDGQTYYKDYLEMYYEMAKEIYEENGEIPPEMWEFFEAYFGGI